MSLARDVLATVCHQPPERWPVERLTPYHARWVWPPTFQGEFGWLTLERTARDGIRAPLVALGDGRVIDGVHRLQAARAAGLAELDVHVARGIPLPLSDDDRWEIERWAVLTTLARRHLTRQQIVTLLIDLDQASQAYDRTAARTSNLKRGGRRPEPLRVGDHAASVAQLAGLSERSVKKIFAISRQAAAPLREAVRSHVISVDEGYRQLTQGAAPGVGAGYETMRRTFERAADGVPDWRAQIDALVASAHECVRLGEELGRSLAAATRRQREAYLDLIQRARARTQEHLAEVSACLEAERSA
jgi:hypothetical protein